MNFKVFRKYIIMRGNKNLHAEFFITFCRISSHRYIYSYRVDNINIGIIKFNIILFDSCRQIIAVRQNFFCRYKDAANILKFIFQQTL